MCAVSQPNMPILIDCLLTLKSRKGRNFKAINFYLSSYGSCFISTHSSSEIQQLQERNDMDGRITSSKILSRP